MSGATKTEQEVLYAAYHWADNPTDRDAKKALYDAVQKDRKASERNRMRNYHREVNRKNALEKKG